MHDLDFLYKKEISSLYKELKEFAKAYPELSEDSILENPHTTRLIQAFSLLHANLSLTLEESFIKFISSLFDILYPHYNLPVPSLSIISIEPEKKVQSIVNLPKGTEVVMECKKMHFNYQLCYDTQLVPVKIIDATCSLNEHIPSANFFSHNIKSSLSIKLESNNQVNFNKINTAKIRFFIKGFNQAEYLIYKNIFNNVEINIICIEDAAKKLNISKDKLKKVGFEESQNIVPSTQNAFPGYRLLTEFFVFPEKFLFFDLDLTEVDLTNFSSSIEVRFGFNNTELVGLISKENFLLNTAPIVNLFSMESDPIEINIEQFEYPIIMNGNPSNNIEVYSINEVLFNMGGKEIKGYPIFNYNINNSKNDLWYNTTSKKVFENGVYKQNKMYIAIANNRDILNIRDLKFFYLKATCFNGNLPNESYLEWGATLNFLDNTIPVSQIKCIIKPTVSQTLCDNKNQKRNMAAHLSPHYMNIFSNTNGVSLIKEILAIYSIKNSKLNHIIIDAIQSIKISEKVKRIQTGRYSQFCKGSYVEFFFDNSHVSDGVLYLFMNVMDYFLAVYCSINSFIQATGKISDSGNILYSGLPRNGLKCLM